MCSSIEDEPRKQADTFTVTVNIRGVTYSPPRTGKLSLSCFFFRSNRAHRAGRHHPPGGPQHRQDLYKKVMSGDPVAARLPYAMLTKMVTFFGLEEVRDGRDSQVPWCYEVTEMTFPSTVRRSLIIFRKGRFVLRTAPQG